jgi:2,5-dihydroxypyridine 5,6-dioxygenase
VNVHLLRRAQVALGSALQLRAGDQLTLVVDDTVTPDLVDAMTAAAEGLGAGVVVVRYTPVEPVAMSEFGLFAGASQRPQPHLPGAAAAAIRAADAAVILNSDMAMMFDQGLRSVIEEGGTKLAWAPYASEDAFLRLLPRSDAECAALVVATEAVAARIAGSHEVRVTSPAGTDLVLRIGAHRVNAGTGSAAGAGYGGLEIWPGGQVSVVPDHSTASGRLVIDRSINAPRFRELSSPIVFTVEEGDVVDVGGSGEGEELAQWLATLDDPAAYHLTELGVGTNPQCRLAGVAAPCEDTHMSGCVSFALGADVHLGGTVTALCHVDMTMRSATLELDGDPVVSRGKVVR